MIELTPQEKLLALQKLGKMPSDDWLQEYMELAHKHSILMTKIAETNKILNEIRDLIMNAPVPSDEAFEVIYKKVNSIQLLLDSQIPRKEMNITEQYIDACKQIEKQKEGT